MIKKYISNNDGYLLYDLNKMEQYIGNINKHIDNNTHTYEYEFLQIDKDGKDIPFTKSCMVADFNLEKEFNLIPISTEEYNSFITAVTKNKKTHRSFLNNVVRPIYIKKIKPTEISIIIHYNAIQNLVNSIVEAKK